MNPEKLTANQKASIKDWAIVDRPREKMIQKGRDVLTDVELVGILLASGSQRESAIDLARRILSSVENDLVKLSQLTHQELMRFHGVGQAKALSISAALELGRRRANASERRVEQIDSSQSAYKCLRPFLSDLDHEEFYALYLNRNNRIIDTVRISMGGVSGTVVDNKVLFRNAVSRLASGIIVAHNHPSGNLQPSQADKELTKNLVRAGQILDVRVLDHLIIAGSRYFSFADSAMI